MKSAIISEAFANSNSLEKSFTFSIIFSYFSLSKSKNSYFKFPILFTSINFNTRPKFEILLIFFTAFFKKSNKFCLKIFSNSYFLKFSINLLDDLSNFK